MTKLTVKYAGRIGYKGEILETFELEGKLVVARPLAEGEAPAAGDFQQLGFGDWRIIEPPVNSAPLSRSEAAGQRIFRPMPVN